MNTNAFMSPTAYLELQAKFIDMAYEATEENVKRFEAGYRDAAQTMNATIAKNTERALEAVAAATKLYSKSLGIARDAYHTAAAPVAAAAKK